MAYLAHLYPEDPLNLVELAALELTNDPQTKIPRGKRKQPNILTTKDVYRWAVVLSEIVPLLPFSNADISDLLVTSRWSANDAHRLLRNVPGPESDLPEELDATADAAYRSLLARGLVEDPPIAIISGIAVLVLGAVPTSFTRKTRAGQVISRKINAAFWRYEKKFERGVTTEIVEFKMLRLIHAFKGAFSGFRAALTQGDHQIESKH